MKRIALQRSGSLPRSRRRASLHASSRAGESSFPHRMRCPGSGTSRPNTRLVGTVSQPLKDDSRRLLSCRQARSYHLSREATAMILGDVFERFAQDSPLSVMARGVMENALGPKLVDELFEHVAD